MYQTDGLNNKHGFNKQYILSLIFFAVLLCFPHLSTRYAILHCHAADVNECEQTPSPCRAVAECIDTDGSYTCEPDLDTVSTHIPVTTSENELVSTTSLISK